MIPRAKWLLLVIVFFAIGNVFIFLNRNNG
jgi:hypothetical protein